MILRAVLALVAVGAIFGIGGTAPPASAQSFSDWERNGHDPFWERRRRDNDDDDDDDNYGDRYDRDEPIISSGGARPVIQSQAPEKIAFESNFVPNSIVIDAAARKLYFILSGTEAYEYPIAVGREGFTWTGTEVISRQQAWPDWHPPKEMIARDPRLPDKMTGGIRNPLGALALYLGKTLYRIHGTNDAKSIGRAASSGCFRMLNEHVLHLASIAPIGTAVTVVKRLPRGLTMSEPPPPPPGSAEPL
jgi:lipoprotein-anchoring transpeptidase ErfK/SrfK